MHEWKLASYFAVVAALMLGGDPAHSQTVVAGFTPGTFGVSETGAAEYRVAIRVPPGIAGMEPKLALAYSSQGGNGMLGVGWALSGLSIIQRCGKTIAQDGLNAGVNYSSSDRYCLDGQRLVSVSGDYGVEGTEYRTESESFTKVISHGTAGSGPQWFEARTKSGIRLEFGNTSDSRLEAQGKTSVRAWAVNRVSDVAGNSVKVQYAEDQANGDFRPDRIDYTENASQATAPFASVRFTYESRSDNNEQYVGGSVVRTMGRLTSIKTYVGESAVTDYRIAYDNGGTGSASRITSIQECTGDGLQCFAPVALTWNTASGSFGYSTAGSPGSAWAAMTGARGVIADADGDGLGDLIYSQGSIAIRYSTGTGFGASVSVGADKVTCIGGMDEVGTCLGRIVPLFGTGDVNGDGRVDIISGNGTVYLSTGSGFQSAGSWGVYAHDYWPAVLADLNGDGLADLVYGNGAIYAAYSTGSSFAGPVFVANDQSGCAQEDLETGCVVHYAKFAAGDVDGDGRADIVTGSGMVYLSTGSGFSSSGNWGASFASATQIDIADSNGDGRGDVVYNDGSAMLVRASTGVGFGPAGLIANDSTGCAASGDVSCTASFAIFAVGDLNGDGLPDAVTGGVGRAIYAATAPTGDRIERITESIGSVIDPSYAGLSNPSVYAMESGAAWPVRELRPESKLNVVVSVSGSDGVGGMRSTSYVYRGGRYHAKGGGFLGFHQLETTDTPTGLRSVRVFGQEYPYHALPVQSRTMQASGSLISQIDNTWTNTPLTAAAESGGNYHRSVVTQSVEKSYELSGTLVTTTTTTTGYDSYGNAASVEVSTGDGYSKTTANTYANDTANWLLGRLTRSSVTSISPSDSKTRTSAFTYATTNGLLTKEIIEPDLPDLCLATEYVYDPFGNKTSATTRNCNGSAGEAAAPTGTAVFASRTSATSYAATAVDPVAGQFSSSSTNALGHSESKEFDRRFGVLASLTGPNGLVTIWAYDNFGRKVLESRADGTSTAWSYSACGTCPANGSYFITVTATGKPTAVSYFDILNREIRTEVQGFDGTLVRRDTQYDALGHVNRVSLPYYATATATWTSFTYDVLGRVLTQTAPNDAVTTTTYNGLTTTVTNALNQTETRIKNSQGQLIQVTRQ